MSATEWLRRKTFAGVAVLERAMRSGADRPLADISNFLLLQYPLALGTAVHATPLVEALTAACPKVRIAVAAKGVAAEIFANNPSVERLIVTPSPLNDLQGAVRELRATQPFSGEPFGVITTNGNERTRIALTALLGASGPRVGYTEARELYKDALRYDPQRSLIDNNLRIVQTFGYEFRHYEPRVFFSDEDLAWAKDALRTGGVRDEQMVVVFVTQTSVTQRKGWRKERFQAAARHMMQRYGAHVVFVGTRAEAEAIETIREGLGEATSSLAGKTTLLQLSALLSLCRVGLTLDTGILHLGRAVGLPMAIIAPAWSPPIEWLPLGNQRYRILKNADMPAATPDYIIDEVLVEEATFALDELIVAFPDGAAGIVR